MKPRKTKRPGIAIYQFPYYKSEQGFLRIFLTKALFACALSFSGAGLFAVLMEMELNPFVPALAASLVCLVTFALLGFFRKLYVALFELAALGISCIWIPVLDSLQDFLRQIFEVADGGLIRTKGIIPPSELNDPIPFFILLCVLFGMLCAFSSSRRFHPIAVLTFAEILMIPAFLGQSLHFSWWLTVLIASVIGLWGATMASAVDVTLSSGWASNLHMSDYVYLKANKKLPPSQRLRSEALHFGRHLSDSITLFIVTLLTVGITASTFPTNGSMKIEDIAMEAMNLTQSVSYWLADIFGSSGLHGYFSADGGNINISGNINPENLPTGNRPVAEIVTATKEKIYLRGDIGYEYKGEQWESILRLDYGEDMEKVLQSYTPEVQFYVTRYLMSRNLPDGSNFIKLQTVKVNYLQDMNTLLMGGIPCVFNFRENDNFSIYGDFVAIADKGSVNSMRTALLYVNERYRDYMLEYADGSHLYDYELTEQWDTLPVPMGFDDYISSVEAYSDFVYSQYTGVPEEERDNIKGFIDEVFGDGFSDYIIVTEDGTVLLNPAVSYQPPLSYYASSIESYLTSGIYRYSLDTDNFSGDNTFLGNFLFDTRAGHCALYATTMCLALRYMGIPARYVTGFTAGGDGYTKTEDGYSYTVLEKDLHAWVEVYYDDVGWIPYDPTPAAGGGYGDTVTTTTTTPPVTTTPTETTSHTTNTRPTETTTTTRPTETSTSGTTTVPSGGGGGTAAADTKPIDPETVRLILIIAGSAVIVLAIVLSIVGALKKLSRKEMERIRFFRTGESVKAVAAMLPFALKLLEMKHIQRRSGETPTEFAKRADDALGGAGIDLERAMPLFERAEFDKAPSFNETEHQTVYECVSKLYGEVTGDMNGIKRLITRIKLFGRVKTQRKEK